MRLSALANRLAASPWKGKLDAAPIRVSAIEIKDGSPPSVLIAFETRTSDHLLCVTAGAVLDEPVTVILDGNHCDLPHGDLKFHFSWRGVELKADVTWTGHSIGHRPLGHHHALHLKSRLAWWRLILHK